MSKIFRKNAAKAAIAALSLFFLISCESVIASIDEMLGVEETGTESPASAERQATPAAQKPTAPAGPMYSGDGGKGISISILSPAGKDLAQDETYLATLIQGVLANDFTKFSAMDVLDRENLDQLLKENMSGYYPDEAEVARFGEIIPSQYIMTGSLTKAGAAGYMLKITVSDSKTPVSKAAYSGTVTRAGLDDFSAIKKASEDLLTQMGVTLTAEGKTALHGGNTQERAAETALARGVTAQRGGSTVAAFSYYSEAADYNAGIPEIDKRLASMTKTIESGNIGENVRNTMQRAQEWDKLLDEAIAFYEQHPVVDVVYNTTAQQKNMNVQNGTVDIFYEAWLEPNARMSAMTKIARAYESFATEAFAGSIPTEKLGRLISSERSSLGTNNFLVFAELTDEASNYLGDSESGFYGANYFYPFIIKFDSNLERIDMPQQMQLYFADVDANIIVGETSLVFLEAGKSDRGTLGAELIFNAIKNIRITPTDKSYSEYFRGKRNYRDGKYIIPR